MDERRNHGADGGGAQNADPNHYISQRDNNRASGQESEQGRKAEEQSQSAIRIFIRYLPI